MDDLLARLSLGASVVLPLLLFMASIYLALHIAFARLIANRDSPVLWFFSVVTGPLTRPVRALLPAGMAEPRIRSVALAIYAGLWLLSVVIRMGTTDPR
jgi:uncharacterized protein YggT (Ycf19 family)